MPTSKPKDRRGDDNVAARKLARSEPLSGRHERSDETVRQAHIGRLKPGSDPSRLIDALYQQGRKYPHEQPVEWPVARAVNRDPNTLTPQEPQAVEDMHDRSYNNDARGWVRAAPNGQQPNGFNGDATRLPNFDRSNPWRKGK